MKITTKAHYGLMAMCELARQYGSEPISVREIADLQNCSNSYMEQIISLLKKSELIKSVRGARGGYTLTREPKDISIGEIIRSLEGPIGFTSCSTEKEIESECGLEGKCCSQSFWKELYENINNFLENKKLSDLIDLKD